MIGFFYFSNDIQSIYLYYSTILTVSIASLANLDLRRERHASFYKIGGKLRKADVNF